MERFDRQDAAYKESVSPTACRKRIAIEAGVTGLWYKYVGIDGRVVASTASATPLPAIVVMADLGICAENLLEVSKAYLAG
jgi:transketolase